MKMLDRRTEGCRVAIERIRKIKSHRIFRGVAWPHDLLDFKEMKALVIK